MGDNRDNSQDSRYLGLVKQESIKGKIVTILWSISEAGRPQWDRLGRSVL